MNRATFAGVGSILFVVLSGLLGDVALLMSVQARVPEQAQIAFEHLKTATPPRFREGRAWAKKPVVPNKIISRCEPIAYSGQRLDPESLLGRRVDINLHRGLLDAVDVDDYLRGYRETPKWPSGEYLGKLMQGYSRMYLYTGDPVILERLSKIVETWLKVQDKDGWLGTGERWGAWDVWEHKYTLLGLVDYYALTGNQSALNAARKIGDLMWESFGPGKRDIMQTGSWAMGSGSILEPMTYLYRYTGDEKYLKFCEYILQAFEGETGPKIVTILTTGSKRVCDITDPWSKRQRNRSKGYEMLAALIGILRMYELTGRPEYLTAAENCWQDIVDKRLYITGTSTTDESFREDHILPGEPADQVGEGCVTAHWIFFNRVLFYLTGEPRYLDEIEKSLYNHLLASQRPQDCYQAYFTPLNGSKQFQCHNVWEGMPPCCVSSVMRCIARTPEVIWAKLTDGGLAILIYNKGRMKNQIQTSNGLLPVALEINSDYPKTGNLTVHVWPEQPTTFRIALRVPVWSRRFAAQVGGRKYTGTPGQFLDINRKWRSGDTIKITMDMNDHLIEGGPSYAGHYAFQHGPQVLALVSKSGSNVLENARVKITDRPKLFDASSSLPDGWIGNQGYGSPNLDSADGILLVPFADAGQLDHINKYRTWIKAKGE